MHNIYNITCVQMLNKHIFSCDYQDAAASSSSRIPSVTTKVDWANPKVERLTLNVSGIRFQGQHPAAHQIYIYTYVSAAGCEKIKYI